MVTGELAVVGVYLTEQTPLESRQEALEKTPGPLLDHEMVPDGARPLTVALQVVAEPTVTETGVHDAVSVAGHRTVVV
jgi:hypothetical protein